MAVRWKAIIIVSLIITTLSGVFLVITIRQQRSEFDRIIASQEQTVSFLIRSIMEQIYENYHSRIKSLVKSRKGVVQAFAAKDKEKLYDVSLPVFNLLKKENPYFKSFYFALPDSTKFLRVHLPDLHDNHSVLSPLVQEVNSVREQRAGYEVGNQGLLYRVVQPVMHGENYLGVVGFGIQAEQLVHYLRGVLDEQVFLAVSQEDIQRAALLEGEKVPVGDYVVLGHGNGIFDILSSITMLKDDRQQVTVGGRTYILLSNLDLQAYDGHSAAKIVMALEITEHVKHLKTLVTFTVLLTLVLLVVSFFVLHVSFGNLIQRIVNLNLSLEESNRDLEKKVKERTSQLEEENAVRKKAQQELSLSLQDLQAANEDLTRKNQELDEFTYVASHDLQEPLRKLVSFSDLLRRDLGDELNDRASKDMEFITDAAMRMQGLVQALLGLSRSGRFELEREKVSLQVCVDAAIGALDLRIKELGAKIVTDTLPTVYVDVSMLTQVFQNLLGNGMKFVSGQKPEIHITVEKVDNVDVFGVKDNGIGIKKEYSKQIFAPFKRLHGRAEYEGTGIGLAICRKIIERHGGKIWVESEPGKGSHFKFTLSD